MTASLNKALWEKYGKHLLVVQPFMDSVIERGDGCYLVDADGDRILDLAAGQFCSILGHSHPKFAARLQEQLAKIVHIGDQYVSEGVLRAAERLTSIAPVRNGKAIFLSTGSEANECAMRMAKAVTGRTGMLGYTRGYYGISLATRNLSSISEVPGKVDFQPAPAHQHKLLSPSSNHCPLHISHKACTGECLEVSFEFIGEQCRNIAAVIVEPVLSAGGMIFPPKEYLQSLHRRAQEIGALFICDEAQTAMGRCGTWFDIQNYGIEPDIVVLSKTAGNGYPIGAVVVSEAVARTLESQGFSNLSSHQNDPLAAVTVQAVIDIVEEEGLLEHSRDMGGYFLQLLARLQERHSLIVDVRGRGLMIGMELGSDGAAEAGNLALHFALLCERRGLHVTFTYLEPVIRFIPPLIISKTEIDVAVGVMDDVLTTLESGKSDLTGLYPSNEGGSAALRRSQQGLSPIRIMRGLWNNPPKEWMGRLRKVRLGQDSR
jgi:2,2-dialkylglycine decarboxylase (pyruvate)